MQLIKSAVLSKAHQYRGIKGLTGRALRSHLYSGAQIKTSPAHLNCWRSQMSSIYLNPLTHCAHCHKVHWVLGCRGYVVMKMER